MFSAFAVDSAGTKQLHLSQARELNRKVFRDQQTAKEELMKQARDSHDH